VRIYTAFTPYGIPAFSGVWRSVGSPPPDTAVWGRPSYVLPVWRNVITKRQRYSARKRKIETWTTFKKIHLVGGPITVRRHSNSNKGLEIPMAVT
jgi:hypothetical protein